MRAPRGSTEQRPDLSSPAGPALWALLAAAAVMRIVSAVPKVPNGLFDDGYITLRYAANLANGLGWVFNPGEHVAGTTSPLLTLILAGVARVVGTSHLEVIALVVGILASLGMLYVSERIFTKAGLAPAVKWATLSALAFFPAFISNAVSGMETPLVLFLMTLSLHLYMRERLVALAIVGVLLLLSRLDTLIWMLALSAHIITTRAREGKPFRELVGPVAIFLAGSGAWLAFAKIYFGSIVPQSLVGKAVSHGAFARLDLDYALGFLSAFVPAQRFGLGGLALIVVVFASMLPAIAHLFRNHPALRPVIYFFPLYVALIMGGKAPLFTWYLVPPKWAFYILLVYSLWRLAVWGAATTKLPLQPARVMSLITAGLFAAGLLSLRTSFGQPPNMWAGVSVQIERDSRPEARVFLEHIGLVGYHSNRYVYDSMGLISPETTKLRRQYGTAWLTKALRQFDADIVLLYEDDQPAISSTIDPDAAWFRSAYQHVRDVKEAMLVSVYYKKGSQQIVGSAAAM